MKVICHPEPFTRHYGIRNLAKRLLPPALLAAVYVPTFVWMIDRWSARDSYFGHGFLIPFVSLYWVYRNLRASGSPERRVSRIGIFFLAAGVLMQILSSLLRIYFLSGFSFILLLVGGIGILWGREGLRRFWFPILFLALMIPLPLLVISQITFKMKLLITEIAVAVIRATGIQVVQEGSYVYTPHSVMIVGDPCSGLRSFLAFLCLGLIFAYQSRLALWKRVVLIACGLPLALLSNVVRIVALGLIGEIYGMETATGFVHDLSGILVFVIALAGFLILRRKLENSYAAAR